MSEEEERENENHILVGKSSLFCFLSFGSLSTVAGFKSSFAEKYGVQPHTAVLGIT